MVSNAKITFKSGFQYKLKDNISIALNGDYLILDDKVETGNNYSEIKCKFKLKIAF